MPNILYVLLNQNLKIWNFHQFAEEGSVVVTSAINYACKQFNASVYALNSECAVLNLDKN